MMIKFTDDLSKQEIHAQGNELAQVMGKDTDDNGKRVYEWPDSMMQHVTTFENPVLVTDNYKIGQLDPTLRDTVFALFASPMKEVRYHRTNLKFDQDLYEGVWSPSIDTLLFCRALRAMSIKGELRGIKSVAEVGPGSGFISKFILDQIPDLEEMVLVDLNPKAGDCVHDNIRDGRVRFIEGDAKEVLSGKKYDLIVSNPPYIPRPGSIDDNPYEGVGLLRYLIMNTPQLTTERGFSLINYSSMADGIVDQAVKESGVEMRVADQMTVPLKVYNVLNKNNGEWLNYLLDKKGLVPNKHEGYEYWHDITIKQVKRK